MTLEKEQQNQYTAILFAFWTQNFHVTNEKSTENQTPSKSPQKLLNFSQMSNFYFCWYCFNPLHKRRVAIRYYYFFFHDNRYDKERGMRKKPIEYSILTLISRFKKKESNCSCCSSVPWIQYRWIDKVIELAVFGEKCK